MGTSAHLPLETVSAYLDGELSEPERHAAQQHLRGCERCSAELAAFGRLESVLAAPAPVDCATALTFISARHDRELTADEALVADAHVATCNTCRVSAASWTRIDDVLAGLPVAQPSRRVDAAIAGLARRTRTRRPTFGQGLPNGVALRAGVAVALVVAVAAAAIQQPAEPAVRPNTEVAQQVPIPPIAPRQVIVASAQQALLNPRTNTLYVANPDAGTVGAVDATTLADIATIEVGGRPSALALNEHANTVLVLDSSQKILSEIDGGKNTLISQIPINVSGTPTTLQVDPTNGRILIGVTEATTSQSAAPSGSVVALDSSSKKLETTSAFAVAARQLVADSRGQRALLVSPDVITVVDASTFKMLDQLPGGVGAAFSAKSNTIAVLSATGTGTRLVLVGDENGAVTLFGSPVAVIALPRGGYAVLTDDTLNGRITEIAADGTPGRSASVTLVGRELSYNAQSGVYSVAGTGGVAIATILGQVAVSTPAPAANAQAPGGSTTTNAKPSASPSAATAVAVAPSAERERVPSLPEAATAAWPGVYRLDLVDRSAPMVVGRGRPGHLWFVDAANRLTSLDATTGQAYTISPLPSDARIRSIEVGASYVYAIDVAASRVYVVSLSSEKVTEIQLPFVKSSAAVTITPDDRLWFAVADQILALDPRNGSIEATNIGEYSVGAMTADSAGRVWFSDEARQKLGLYDRRTSSVLELSLPHKGMVTSMIVDGSGALVVGTDAGDVFVIQNGTLLSSRALGRAVTQLALDPRGNAWYLTNDSRQAVMGSARSATAQTLPTSVVGIWFDARANAWLADRTASGFFIAVPEAR